jgi:putative exporter of polyketide antibiotics
MMDSPKHNKQDGVSFCSIKNPSIYLSIIIAGTFFISLCKPLGYIYWGPFAVMTWLSFFMCIGMPIIIGSIFIRLQSKRDAQYTAARQIK